MADDLSPYIHVRLARLKFDLTNQDSAGKLYCCECMFTKKALNVPRKGFPNFQKPYQIAEREKV